MPVLNTKNGFYWLNMKQIRVERLCLLLSAYFTGVSIDQV
jgi:hypothetical protein